MAADRHQTSGAGAVTEDAFLEGLITAFQPAQGFRAGIDAVFLAASVPAVAGDRILELGTGAGIASLCLLARQPECRVTGVEIQPELCELARRNARHNGYDDRLDVIEADIYQIPEKNGSSRLPSRGFDHVFANPPYYDEASVRTPPDVSKATAHSLRAGGLEHWIEAMVALARPKATITLIYTADKLGDILKILDKRIGGIVASPLHPDPDAPASRVIVQGVKGSRAPFALNPGLVLHRPGGGFTPRAHAVLRSGESFIMR